MLSSSEWHSTAGTLRKPDNVAERTVACKRRKVEEDCPATGKARRTTALPPLTAQETLNMSDLDDTAGAPPTIAHAEPVSTRTLPPDQGRPREAWGTRLGVILAVMGSAVGLGNFLRFPGKAAQYEGGAFMIPYFIALLVLGIPLAWAEWAIGRYGGARGFNSSPGIYRTIWKNNIAPYFGVLAMLIPVVVYMYYVFIEGWCLAYAWDTAMGNLELGNQSAPYGEHFGNFVGINSNGFLMGDGGINKAVIFLLICFVLNFGLIYRGLSKGIERFCLFAMPLLIVLAIIVLIRVLTLGTPDPSKPEQSLSNGLGYMWNLRTSEGGLLKSLFFSANSGQMWMEATGQIFFSLSVGFGIVVTYASYLRRNDDVALSSLTSASGNEFCEVALGGMITIPAAFIFLGTAGIVGQGTFGLGFNVLPQVFAMMPLGRLVGTLFFLLLFLAAITSSLSMLQPAIALLEEGLGFGRKAAVAFLGTLTLFGALFVVYFSQGLTALDTIDFWVGTFCIFILAGFQTILFGWVMGADRGVDEINRGSAIRIPRFVGFVLKYIAPVYLAAVFVMFAMGQGSYFRNLMNDRIAQLSIGLVLLVAAIFVVIIFFSIRRWKATGQLARIDSELEEPRAFEVIR
jgi:SNF family Na+-dependent transporter